MLQLVRPEPQPTVTLNWQRVLYAKDFDGHLDFLNSNGGIYIWLWNDRVIYVGQTANFSDRLVDHCTNQLAGLYTTHHLLPDDDFVEFVRDHYHSKTTKQIADEGMIYIPTLHSRKTRSFTRTFLDENRLSCNKRFLDGVRFAFATVETEGDLSLKVIEAGLIYSVRSYYQELTNCDLKMKGSTRPELKIGAINKYADVDFELNHVGAALNDVSPDVLQVKEYRC